MKCPSCIPKSVRAQSVALAVAAIARQKPRSKKSLLGKQTEVAAVRVAVADGGDRLVSCSAALSLSFYRVGLCCRPFT